VRACGADVVMSMHMRPVLREDRSRPWVNLHLPADVEAGTLEAKVEAPYNAREQTTDS
jgi:hypothetical protein